MGGLQRGNHRQEEKRGADPFVLLSDTVHHITVVRIDASALLLRTLHENAIRWANITDIWREAF